MSSGLVSIGEGLYELGLPGERGPIREGFGGDAANTAVMAALMGAESKLVGRIGDDALGRRLLTFWRMCGVDVDDVVVDPERPTGIYVNDLGASGAANRFDYHRYGSAGSRLRPSDLPELDGVRWVHYTGIGISVSQSSAAACSALAAAARKAGSSISFAVNFRSKLAPDPDAVREAAAHADLVFLSEDDATMLYGDTETALTTLSQARAEVVLTLGAAGAVLVAGGGRLRLAAPTVPVVDTAGAGDALAGAYLATRLSDEPPAVALAAGVTAAALSCGRYGCASSYPSARRVRASLALHAPLSGATGE